MVMKIRGMALAALLSLAQPVFAAYTVTIYESGGNVIAEGSGSVNFGGLSLLGPGSIYPYTINQFRTVCIGSGTVDVQVPINWYSGITEIPAFGPNSFPQAIADTGSGAAICIIGSTLLLPQGYVSGAPLGTSTATWQGATLSGMGLTPGTYQSTFGEGENADSYTLIIRPPAPPVVTAVPTLSALGSLAAAGLLGLAGVLRLRRKSNG